MTKKELLEDLKAKPFCDKVLGAEEVVLADNDLKKTNGIKWYRVSFMEVVGKVAISRSINAYVYAEGTANEKAFYGETEPKQQIKIA